MSEYNYTSSTDFDKALVLNITETNDGRHTKFYYRGFHNINEAQRFATWWEGMWSFGYNGVAYAAEEVEAGAVVRASRYNSCD